jgi:hypothetical protein
VKKFFLIILLYDVVDSIASLVATQIESSLKKRDTILDELQKNMKALSTEIREVKHTQAAIIDVLPDNISKDLKDASATRGAVSTLDRGKGKILPNIKATSTNEDRKGNPLSVTPPNHIQKDSESDTSSFFITESSGAASKPAINHKTARLLHAREDCPNRFVMDPEEEEIVESAEWRRHGGCPNCSEDSSGATIRGLDGKLQYVENLPRVAGITNKGDLTEKGRKRRQKLLIQRKEQQEKLALRYNPCKSTVFQPSEFEGKKLDISEPNSNLVLEYVYGYHNTGVYVDNKTTNIFYLASGEMVYFTAALIVISNPKTMNQRFFHFHQDDVTCIAVHPNGVVCASGQLGRSPRYIYIYYVYAQLIMNALLNTVITYSHLTC